MIRTYNTVNENGQWKKVKKRTQCPCILHEPIKPYIWKRQPGPSDAILSLFVDRVEDKEFIRVEDLQIERLKNSLIRWGTRYKTFSFINNNIPESLRKNDVA